MFVMNRKSLLLLALLWGCGGNTDEQLAHPSPYPESPQGGAAGQSGGSGQAGKISAGHGGGGYAQGGAGSGQGGAGSGQGGAGSGQGGYCAASKPGKGAHAPEFCDCWNTPADFYWNGSSCTQLPDCCTPADPGPSFSTLEECLEAYQPCLPCGATTEIHDFCDCAPGKLFFWWDGNECQSSSGCCPEAEGKIYDSLKLCEKDHENCEKVECQTFKDCPQLDCIPCGDECPTYGCVDGKCVAMQGPACAPVCPPECKDGCNYSDKQCGQGTGIGQAVSCLVPSECKNTFAPVCGCNGVVYQNSCQANNAGVDLSQLGSCTTPPGYFACGDHFCKTGAEYCQQQLSDVGGFADEFSCLPIPVACPPNNTSCDCYKEVPCGLSCEHDSAGNMQVTCGGGLTTTHVFIMFW